MLGGKIIYAYDENGSVGKKPRDEPHMTAEGICALEAHYKASKLDEWRRVK